jgi:hypothetical protein
MPNFHHKLLFLILIVVLTTSCVTPAKQGVTPEQIKELETIGLKFGQEYNAAKLQLLSQGWTLDEGWSYSDDPDGRPKPGTNGYYPLGYGVEFRCGAVTCAARYLRGKEKMLLIVFPHGRKLLVDSIL